MQPLAVRSHEEMKDVLMNPNADGPENHYYMIRGGKNKSNITIWESGVVGSEFIKTYGHYHVGDVDETYSVVGGEGILLIQKRKIKDKDFINDEIDTFVAIKVKAGDVINIPSKIGHLIVNTGERWLITIDNSPLEKTDSSKYPSHADYESVKKMHGFAYYIVKDIGIKFIKNSNYITIPNVTWLTPEQWNKIGKIIISEYE